MQTKVFTLSLLLSVVTAQQVFEGATVVTNAVPHLVQRTEGKPRLQRAPTGHASHDSGSSSSVTPFNPNDIAPSKGPGFDISMDDYEKYIKNHDSKRQADVKLPTDPATTEKETEVPAKEEPTDETPPSEEITKATDDSSTQVEFTDDAARPTKGKEEINTNDSTTGGGGMTPFVPGFSDDTKQPDVPPKKDDKKTDDIPFVVPGDDKPDLPFNPNEPIYPGNCWKRAYGRGVGKPIHTCEEGWERNGALCYPLCEEGFKGVGPVCWERCPADGSFRNDGAYCGKPKSYGRGGGFAKQAKCEKKKGTACEKKGLLWYPECKKGFHAFGCCVCSPDCPDTMKDIGVSCHKRSHNRPSKVLQCDAETQEKQAGLCYTPCRYGAVGKGPVCWGNCPNGTIPCAGTLCINPMTGSSCTAEVLRMIENGVKTVTGIATGTATEAVINIGSYVNNFAYPVCPDY